MIDNLVMEPSRLRTLKALAKSFARQTKEGDKIKEGPWSADFVKGKGNGLIFLLHGKPGVGKTCTAGKICSGCTCPLTSPELFFMQAYIDLIRMIECIAEYTQRPLMVLTSSDIGTDSVIAEANLKREFKKAKSWGAVLLIDEADVFMQERNIRDLTRNTLVAGTSPFSTLSSLFLTSNPLTHPKGSYAPSNSLTASSSSPQTASAFSTTPSSPACTSSCTTPNSTKPSAHKSGKPSLTSSPKNAAKICGCIRMRSIISRGRR